MSGKLFGVGVGPGDPELLTIKAYNIIKNSDVVLFPGKTVKDSVAYKIVSEIIPKIDQKTLLAVDMPMTKDQSVLEESHEKGAKNIIKLLDEDKVVAFLTLGDPTVYSTYMYIHKKIVNKGYPVEIISGITSFCAAAARLSISLAEKEEELHIIPASYQIEEALRLSGTKVLMKAGRKISEVKTMLIEKKLKVMMVENCGMPNEKIYQTAEEIPDDAGYYSLFIVKGGESQ